MHKMDKSMSNRVYIAAAGSGKTTLLVKKACEIKSPENVLILTYTDSNEDEIRKKFHKINRFIPENVCVQTWFSFLFQFYIKPYQNYLTHDDFDIKGLIIASPKGNSTRWRPARSDWKHYYFTKENRALGEKLSELALDCNNKSGNLPLNRLTNIFEHIFIDEVQDLAGYDLDLLKQLFLSKSEVILAGDPRQTTYLTNHNGNKNIGYRDGKIIDYLEAQKELKNKYIIDFETLNKSWRCCQEICDFASRISRNFPQTVSRNESIVPIKGVYLIKPEDKERFMKIYTNMIQLRWNKRITGIIEDLDCMNFGESKGLTFDGVLIYPTTDMKKWIENNDMEFKFETRCKFYVAVTRAKYVVGIVWDKNTCSASELKFWK